MKQTTRLLAGSLLLGMTLFASEASHTPAPCNGIDYPVGWRHWSVIALSHRIDNHTERVILGNDVAIEAIRHHQTNPWPDGAILAKVVWKERRLKRWHDAVVPRQFVHAEFMFKNATKYRKTHGWGWARWVSEKLQPFRGGDHVCMNCHKPVASHDWVYTEPAQFPKRVR
ncbi:cytochrome P460 family protein [Hydrogenimonas urashimensis]|uniref:cytochrome P460 family protein n=1 Tax=Hydrogenimonas urashimensis TaxID=2740515 RepID=UPI0019162DE6|nr:cytochrome P460 family protein [Hydrogenimonas urashimensis]